MWFLKISAKQDPSTARWSDVRRQQRAQIKADELAMMGKQTLKNSRDAKTQRKLEKEFAKLKPKSTDDDTTRQFKTHVEKSVKELHSEAVVLEGLRDPEWSK